MHRQPPYIVVHYAHHRNYQETVETSQFGKRKSSPKVEVLIFFTTTCECVCVCVDGELCELCCVCVLVDELRVSYACLWHICVCFGVRVFVCSSLLGVV